MLLPCQYVEVAPVHNFPSFRQVDPADTDRVLDQKRARSFCNALTAKKVHFTDINVMKRETPLF